MLMSVIMSGSVIQFDRFSVDSQHLDTQEILPIHKKQLHECLSKIFQQYVGEAPRKEVPFYVQLKTGAPVLSVGGQEIRLAKSPELKRLGRMVRYYQHMGQLPRAQGSFQNETQKDTQTQKVVRGVNQASIPGSNGAMLAGMRLADDSVTLARNIMLSIPSVSRKDPVVAHLGYYAGIFWSFFSFRELDDGFTEYKRSNVIRDAEGMRRAESRILSGSLVAGGSLAFLGGQFCSSYASKGAVSTAFGFSNALFGFGAILAIGASVLGGVRCHRFNHRLNEYLYNPKLPEAQKMQGALRFLKDAISVTAEERAELAFQIEQKHPDWSLEQKELLLGQRIADLTEVKVKYMKRRTSNKSLLLILNRTDDLLLKLGNPSTCAEGIKEATVLIDKIKQENRVKLSLYFLGTVASIISFVGMLVMSFMSAGVLPFILNGMAGTIYLAVTVYTVAGTFFKKAPPQVAGEVKDENLVAVSSTEP